MKVSKRQRFALIGRLEEFQFLKEAQTLKMKVLRRERFFHHRKARGVIFHFKESGKVLKCQAFFIIGRLGELSFILKKAESLKMKVLTRRHLSSKERLGECRPQEPTCDPYAVRLDKNVAHQMLSAYRVCHAKFR